MKRLSLDFKQTEAQRGALTCKANIQEVFKRLNDIDIEEEEAENKSYQPKLLVNRTKIIEEIVKRLGDLSEFQAGYISSLLEYAEFNTQTDNDVNCWRPSLVTGKWQ